MSTDHALAELRQSPLLPDHIAALQADFEAEQRRRGQFLAEIDETMKAEFINGQMVLHSPARRAHIKATLHGVTLLDQYAKRHGLGEVLMEKCLVRCQRNDYEPDICFFDAVKTEALDVNQMVFPPPDLIVEVLSPSTRKNDRTLKLQDYAHHGVGEYWIIDTDERMVEQYILPPGATEYTLKARITEGGQLVSVMVAGFAIPILALFDARENQRVLLKLLGDQQA